jgi:hypothetical protein
LLTGSPGHMLDRVRVARVAIRPAPISVSSALILSGWRWLPLRSASQEDRVGQQESAIH